MVIHIALVGRESGHIWNGLKEIIPVDKLYLLHSANDDFYKYTDEAKKLKKEIEIMHHFVLPTRRRRRRKKGGREEEEEEEEEEK